MENKLESKVSRTGEIIFGNKSILGLLAINGSLFISSVGKIEDKEYLTAAGIVLAATAGYGMIRSAYRNLKN